MSEPLALRVVACPHCWQHIELVLDLSAGAQRYVEDCPVCCRPIDVSFEPGAAEELTVSIERAD